MFCSLILKFTDYFPIKEFCGNIATKQVTLCGGYYGKISAGNDCKEFVASQDGLTFDVGMYNITLSTKEKDSDGKLTATTK